LRTPAFASKYPDRSWEQNREHSITAEFCSKILLQVSAVRFCMKFLLENFAGYFCWRNLLENFAHRLFLDHFSSPAKFPSKNFQQNFPGSLCQVKLQEKRVTFFAQHLLVFCDSRFRPRRTGKRPVSVGFVALACVEEEERKAMDVDFYPSIAVSDAVNSACCLFAARKLSGVCPDAALGIGFVAAASGVGTLRFGFAPKTFAWWNGFLADAAGKIGIPMMCLGLGLRTETLTMGSLAALILGFAVEKSMFLSEEQSKRYTTVASILGLGLLLVQRPESLSAIALFITGGLLVGNDRHRLILGVRRENIFHYIMGTSMILFSQLA